MITRSLFLLVSCLVFFIDNDEAEIFEWREHGAARTDDNSGPTRVDLVPFIVTLAFGQMAVQDCHRILRFRETAFETLYGLGRERDFRNENNRAASTFE